MHRALLATLMLFVAAPASASTGSIPLPTEPNAVVVPSGTVFAPNNAPGTVEDREHVAIESGFNGIPHAISVDQTLQLHGVGDYSLTIPANAVGVSAPAFQPTLRRGNIVWAGFCTGSRTLSATASLDPILELTRLPIAVKATLPTAEAPLNGQTQLTVHVQNTSADVFTLTDGDPELPSLRDAIDAARAALAMNQPPVAGASGVPGSVAGTAGQSTQVPVPTRIAFTIIVRWSSGSLDMAPAPHIRVLGHSVETDAVIDATTQSFDLVIKGTAHQLKVGSISVLATPELPILSFNTPGPNDPPSAAREALRNLEMLVAQAARTKSLMGYLGNPWTGSSRSTYEWNLRPQAPAAVRVKQKANAFGISLSILALALAGGVGFALRARS